MLSFVARLPDTHSFPRSGRYGDFVVRRVMFSLEGGDMYGRDLVMRQWPIQMEMDEDEQNKPLVLAHNVKEFLIEPWDNRKGEWMDAWTETNQIPALIRVSLALGAGETGRPDQTLDTISRVLALPSITVPASWQTPALPGGQGVQGAQGAQGANGTQLVPGGQGDKSFKVQ